MLTLTVSCSGSMISANTEVHSAAERQGLSCIGLRQEQREFIAADAEGGV